LAPLNGYGSHTYMWINAKGEKFWVKYHFHTDQRMQFFSNEEAAAMADADAGFHGRDLFDAIAPPVGRFRCKSCPMPMPGPTASTRST
jgi:catalase